MSTSDQILYERWVSGADADAFAEIVSRHAGMVYGTCWRILRNAADAQEVAQECFLLLAQGRTRKVRSLGGWLHVVARSRALNRIKAAERRLRLERQFVKAARDTVEIEWDDMAQVLDDAIGELPERLRVVIIYRFLEARTHAQIARELSVAPETVRYRIKRGLDQLRKALSKKGIVASSSSLLALLTSHGVEAAPSSMMHTLTRTALAMSCGNGSAGATVSPKTGGPFMLKKSALAAGVRLVTLGVICAFVFPKQSDPSLSAATGTGPGQPVAESDPASAAASGQGSLVEGGPPAAIPATPTLAPEETASPDSALARTVASLLRGARMEAQNTQKTPLSSAEIPADNGFHHFIVAAELFNTLDIDIEQLESAWHTFREYGTPFGSEELAALDACWEALESVRVGIGVGNARVPLGWRLDEDTWYLLCFRNLAKVVAINAEIDAAMGDHASAFDDLATLLAFGRESSSSGLHLHGHVGYKMQQLAVDSLLTIIDRGGISAGEYRALTERLAPLSNSVCPLSELVLAEADRARFWLADDSGRTEQFRAFLRDNEEFIAGRHAAATIENMSDAELLAIGRRDLMADYDVLAARMEVPYFEAPLLGPFEPTSGIVARLLFLDSYEDTRYMEGCTQAQTRGALLVAAIELYGAEQGTYPGSLDELVPNTLSALPEDPFTGQDFLYAKTALGYSLYSTGPDMQDNGGTLSSWAHRAPGKDLVLHGAARVSREAK